MTRQSGRIQPNPGRDHTQRIPFAAAPLIRFLQRLLLDGANGADDPVLRLLLDHRAAVRAPRARVHVERRAAAGAGDALCLAALGVRRVPVGRSRSHS